MISPHLYLKFPIEFSADRAKYAYSVKATCSMYSNKIHIINDINIYGREPLTVLLVCSSSIITGSEARNDIIEVAGSVAYSAYENPKFYDSLMRFQRLYLRRNYRGSIIDSFKPFSQNDSKNRGVNFSNS